MDHDFNRLMSRVAAHHFKENCTVGNWHFDAYGAGSFTLSYCGTDIIVCKNNQIVDVQWGRRVEDLSPSDLLTIFLEQAPQVNLDPRIIRTDDCFSALGYSEHSEQISTVSGLHDIDYYRAWVTSKANRSDPERADYIVYWDLGNTWCDVLAVFEGVTHEEFVAEMHVKYKEWIQEEPSFDGLEEDMPQTHPASLTEQIQDASARACGPHFEPDRQTRNPEPEY